MMFQTIPKKIVFFAILISLVGCSKETKPEREIKPLFSAWLDLCVGDGPTRANAHTIASNLSLQSFNSADLTEWKDRLQRREQQINEAMQRSTGPRTPRVAQYLNNPEGWWFEERTHAALQYAIYVQSMTTSEGAGHVSSKSSSCAISGDAASYREVAWMFETIRRLLKTDGATPAVGWISFGHTIPGKGVFVGGQIMDMRVYELLFGKGLKEQVPPWLKSKGVVDSRADALGRYFDQPIRWSFTVSSASVDD